MADLLGSRFRQDVSGPRLAPALQDPDLKSVVISRRGDIVLEEYLGGADAETLHDVRSAAKSITGTLVGIAIDDGAIANVDARLLDFFPRSAAARAPGKETLTIRHLLQMRSGLDADEDDPASPGSEEHMEAARDWVRFALDTPLTAAPGERWAYASVNTVLLGYVVSTATGRDLADYAHEKLFGPLGIRQYEWRRAPLGHVVAQGNLAIRPRDFLAFGELFLKRGRWDDRRLVPEPWIREATREHTILPSDPTTGYGDLYTGYGYHWWTGRERLRDAIVSIYFASGRGGQKLFVIPGLELVLAITSSGYGRIDAHAKSHAILRGCLAAYD